MKLSIVLAFLVTLSCDFVISDSLNGADPAELEFWRRRFLADREAIQTDGSGSQDPMVRLAVLQGNTLLDELGDPVAFAREWARDMEFSTWEHALQQISSVYSTVDRLDEALAIADEIPTASRRQRALSLIAHRQADRGDLKDAMNVAKRLESPYRDDVIEKIVAKHLDQQQFDRLDWFYHEVEGRGLRLVVCSIAITELAKQPAE